MKRFAVTAGLLIATAVWSGPSDVVDRIPMNQVQVVGSHNSYKLAIDPGLFAILRSRDAKRYESLDYDHISLSDQLDRGLRNLELDVVHDPEGGRFASPLGLKWLGVRGGGSPAPFDPHGEMGAPGFKVLHVPDVDFRTNVYTFRTALRELKAWSDRNPHHLPVAVTMNAKDAGAEVDGAVKPLAFDRAAMDAWDAEIREVLPAAKLITPDDVRGTHTTLEEAVLAHAWPSIGRARGKFLFVLDETGPKLETYVADHPSLRRRAMFVNAREGRPEAAFRIVNEPIERFGYIQKLVRAGYLVRTRADADTDEARRNDFTRMQAAFDSGAHFVTTDYYRPNPAFGTGYRVELPGGGPGRWNPVLPPPLRHLPPPERERTLPR